MEVFSLFFLPPIWINSFQPATVDCFGTEYWSLRPFAQSNNVRILEWLAFRVFSGVYTNTCIDQLVKQKYHFKSNGIY